MTASRCRTPSVVREPRRVLPSIASTRRRPAGGTALLSCWIQALIAVSNRSGFRRCTSRRTADSDGGAALIPSVAATSTGRSAAHSAIATNERAPAATAHTATDSSVTSSWRTPRRLRGSVTVDRTVASPGAADAGSGRFSPATRSSTAGIGEDTTAGTALFR